VLGVIPYGQEVGRGASSCVSKVGPLSGKYKTDSEQETFTSSQSNHGKGSLGRVTARYFGVRSTGWRVRKKSRKT